MSPESHDPREIPVLTETIEAARAAVLAEALQLTDSLLRQAAREIDARRFESLLERLRAELPAFVDRLLREQCAAAGEQDKARD